MVCSPLEEFTYRGKQLLAGKLLNTESIGSLSVYNSIYYQFIRQLETGGDFCLLLYHLGF